MKVIVHYPSDEKAKEELKKRASEVHSGCNHLIWTHQSKQLYFDKFL